MLAPLAACRVPTGKLWQLCKVLYVFEHKTQYLLIHALFIYDLFRKNESQHDTNMQFKSQYYKKNEND